MNLMVTINPRSRIATQKIKGEKIKHNTTESLQSQTEQKKGTNNYKYKENIK